MSANLRRCEINDTSFRIFAELSNECREYQNLARKFAREEIIPVAAHHDQTGEVSMGQQRRVCVRVWFRAYIDQARV